MYLSTFLKTPLTFCWSWDSCLVEVLEGPTFWGSLIVSLWGHSSSLSPYISYNLEVRTRVVIRFWVRPFLFFFKKGLNFFRAALGSQQNWEAGIEIPQIASVPTHACFSLLSPFWISAGMLPPPRGLADDPGFPIMTIFLSFTFFMALTTAWHYLVWNLLMIYRQSKMCERRHLFHCCVPRSWQCAWHMAGACMNFLSLL